MASHEVAFGLARTVGHGASNAVSVLVHFGI